ncbi:MAG: hypothetical protein GXY55_05650 [Phycisphaerae bacterium]|nr:hypothetical protein [Phycisphaerae bacterium]
MLLALLAVGWWVAQWRAQILDKEQRGDLLRQAIAIARTINPDGIKTLSFTAADLKKPEFHRLRRQMIAYGQTMEVRGIYTMAERDGAIVFGPENYAEDDPQASSPGTEYEEPSAIDWAVLRAGKPGTIGPQTDEYGTFISAVAPVFDPRTGQVLMAVGLDIEAGHWRTMIHRERLAVGLVVLALAVILACGGRVLRYRDALPLENQTWLRFGECYLVAGLGLALTVIVAKTLADAEEHSRREVFLHLAESQAGRVAEAFRDLRDNQLDGLVRFFASSEEVDAEEFRLYTKAHTKLREVYGIGWAPRVSAAAKSVFEEQVRKRESKAFTVFEKDSQGRNRPAGARDEYFPLLYIEPLEENPGAIGFDLISESTRKAAIEEATRTGMITATDLVETAHGRGLVVMVYAPNGTAVRRGVMTRGV